MAVARLTSVDGSDSFVDTRRDLALRVRGPPRRPPGAVGCVSTGRRWPPWRCSDCAWPPARCRSAIVRPRPPAIDTRRGDRPCPCRSAAAPAQPIELASITFGRAPGATIPLEQRHVLVAGRRRWAVIDEAGLGD